MDTSDDEDIRRIRGTDADRPQEVPVRRTMLQLPWDGAHLEGLPQEEIEGTSGGDGRGATLWEHEDRGGKRVGHQEFNSSTMTKDFMGACPLPAGRSDSSLLYTDILTTHLAIPRSPSAGPVFTYVTYNNTDNIQPTHHSPTSMHTPLLELTNRYSVLSTNDTNNSSLECFPPSIAHDQWWA